MSKTQESSIHIKGAREHNLKDLEVRLPRGQFTVITGISGSGKSSFAFDTLYAEGYRQYLDALSTRARAALEQLPRPDVDFIHGLSPVIAIEQGDQAGCDPRTTVASATEIASYARLLWAYAGQAHCPYDGSPIVRRTLDECVQELLQFPEGTKAILLAPLFRGKVSIIREELPRLRQRGYQRVRIDGDIVELTDPDPLHGRKGTCTLELVTDRLVLRKDQQSRIADSLELCFREGDQQALALWQNKETNQWEEKTLTCELACTAQGHPFSELSPRMLSADHPSGACETCGGLGEELTFTEALVVPDPTLSVKKGALKPLRYGSKQMIIRHNALLKQLAEQIPFDATLPWQELPETTRQTILHGCRDARFVFQLQRGKKQSEPQIFEGVVPLLKRLFAETTSAGFRRKLMGFQTRSACPDCGKTRLSARVRAITLHGHGMHHFMAMSVEDAEHFLQSLDPEKDARLQAVSEALTRLREHLGFLRAVGLGYLTLERPYASLSGGEAQRVRLGTQLGVGLTGVIYVLDEPSIGLHPADHAKLIGNLQLLQQRGNTLVVVEHDDATMRCADRLLEIGPGAGEAGGQLVFEGTLQECQNASNSRTGGYLSGRETITREASRKTPGKNRLRIAGANEHNLQNIDVDIPLGLFTVVCGVSGSGKSTLVLDILARHASMKLHRAKQVPGKHQKIDGLEHLQAVVQVDQSPIGRSPRSNPATYVKLFDDLRNLFAQCSLARIRGYTAGRFSFNTRGGRCERCQGDGQIKMDMHFLDDVYTTCPSCGGMRYNRETLEVRYKGYNIAEILQMTVAEARTLFRNQPRILRKLDTLASVGLDYLRLGQPAHTLSGGEAQRIKLALELSRKTRGETLYILDEPTTGLHWDDIQHLCDLLFRLREEGHTIVLIEHQLDLIRLADWIIEIGPGGGIHGGQLVHAGDLTSLLENPQSRTAPFLRDAAQNERTAKSKARRTASSARPKAKT